MEEDSHFVSDDMIASCLSFFKSATVEDFMNNSRYRDVRKVLHPFSIALNARYYDGEVPSEKKLRKRAEKESKAQITKQKMKEKEYVNAVALRKLRIERKDKLIEEDGLNLRIADGPINLTLNNGAIENGVEENEVTEAQPQIILLRSCYRCKKRFSVLHFFYDSLCEECSSFSWKKRMDNCDLIGFVCVLTGGRVRIGFQVGLRLLRNGATLIVSSRFPRDTILRYSKESDFSTWSERLFVYGIDLRDFNGIEKWCELLKAKFSRIDCIINNACQTVRRPTSYYSHLIDQEMTPLKLGLEERFCHHESKEIETTLLLKSSSSHSTSLSSNLTYSSSSALMSQMSVIQEDRDLDLSEKETLFPDAKDGSGALQIDLRKVNSWILKLGEVQTGEAAEVFAINALAPFIINSNLLPCLLKAVDVKEEKYAFVINVSAMEGKFYRNKTPCHPHTNMAKAALNMMTRTCGADLERQGIFMNSVDTGWINDENPLEIAFATAERNNFQTPLDEIEAASRITDPFFVVLNKEEKGRSGIFFKDYVESEW